MTRMTLGLLMLALTVSCASARTIVAESEVLREDVTRARSRGALDCAPTTLAIAEANLDFTEGDLSQASTQRAGEHLNAAKAAVEKLKMEVQDCALRRLPPTPVKVEDTDADHDGVIDRNDKCPNQAGPPPTGCPVVAGPDSDGDGIPDALDKCPGQPEDKDGFQDEDGCPDIDNDNDGLVDTKDKCPNEAGPIEAMGCPVKDRDGDGIMDDVDKCPDEPEDKDGFQDEDGCPDPDNDNDGIPDVSDKCPNEAGPAEEQGCPRKYEHVVVKKDRIELRQQLRFKTKSARIVGIDSFAVIAEMAQVLRDTPQIKKLRIEGHTDSVGNDAANLKLSQSRADAVRDALIKSGIDPSRLEAIGFGETRPIASNSSATGRAENRRTEFNIVEQ
jgi:outer membrane protein OmpA-like peptidoglycan-associated protein